MLAKRQLIMCSDIGKLYATWSRRASNMCGAEKFLLEWHAVKAFCEDEEPKVEFAPCPFLWETYLEVLAYSSAESSAQLGLALRTNFAEHLGLDVRDDRSINTARRKYISMLIAEALRRGNSNATSNPAAVRQDLRDRFSNLISNLSAPIIGAELFNEVTAVFYVAAGLDMHATDVQCHAYQAHIEAARAEGSTTLSADLMKFGKVGQTILQLAQAREHRGL